MNYLVYKKVNGRFYTYLQRSYRVGKKVKTESVYIGPASGPTPRGAAEHAEAAGLLAERNNMEADLYRLRHAADLREARYKLGRASKEFRERQEFQRLREAARRETDELARQTPVFKGKPTDEDEVDLTHRIEQWDEKFNASLTEYNAENKEPSEEG